MGGLLGVAAKTGTPLTAFLAGAGRQTGNLPTKNAFSGF